MKSWPQNLLTYTIIFRIFKHFFHPRCSLQRRFIEKHEKLRKYEIKFEVLLASKSGPHIDYCRFMKKLRQKISHYCTFKSVLELYCLPIFPPLPQCSIAVFWSFVPFLRGPEGIYVVWFLRDDTRRYGPHIHETLEISYTVNKFHHHKCLLLWHIGKMIFFVNSKRDFIV